MEDIDYNELFGIEAQPGSEENREIADPGTTDAIEQAEDDAGETLPESEEAQETEAEPDGEQDAGTAETSNKTQSREENARYAAARRKAERERDAAIEKAKADAAEEANRKIAEMLKLCRLQDPYSGETIDTPEKFGEYAKQHAAERKAAILRKAGMSDEEFNSFLAEQPEIREAREAKKKADDAAAEAAQERAKARIDSQMEEIRKLDPTIKEIGDLAGLKSYNEIYDKVKQGYSLLDAYKLANWEELQKNAAAAAQQAARNANSKNHMQAHSARGSGAVTVPADIMESYRIFNPGMSDAEITAHYNKYIKH